MVWDVYDFAAKAVRTSNLPAKIRLPGRCKQNQEPACEQRQIPGSVSAVPDRNAVPPGAIHIAGTADMRRTDHLPGRKGAASVNIVADQPLFRSLQTLSRQEQGQPADLTA